MLNHDRRRGRFRVGARASRRCVMSFVTMQGKAFAMEILRRRRVENAAKPRIDDSRLPAGSPMHFYCISCGAPSDVLPENYVAPPKRLCGECQDLKDLGWLE